MVTECLQVTASLMPLEMRSELNVRVIFSQSPFGVDFECGTSKNKSKRYTSKNDLTCPFPLPSERMITYSQGCGRSKVVLGKAETQWAI